MGTVKLLGVWVRRHVNHGCFNRFNTRINNYEAPRCVLCPGRDFCTVSAKDTDAPSGRRRGLRAADIAEKLRSEKEKGANNKVSHLNLTYY